MGYKIEGLNELKQTTRELSKSVEPTVQKMGDVARVLLTSIDKTFATNGRGTWPAHAPSTREGVAGMLQFTGKLRASIEPGVSRNSAQAKPSNAVYKYGAVNNYGSKSGRIPARPFMKLFPDDIDAIMDVLEAPIDKALKK